ncbi:MAG: YebC/PmpR family DNA-binding transcriptional regulator [Patescibacteria group bacterium]
MSGHSKWAQIKRQKGATDAKKANTFARLAKVVTLAAKEGGGNPDMNFKLRLAMDQARAVNMPKDNIEKAIKRGTGELAGQALEELTYECFGPSGSAFIVDVVTDNRNRAASEIKHIFSENNGNLGNTNSVSWMFDKVGGIKATKPTDKNKEETELITIDAGAEDFEWLDDDTIWVYTKPTEVQKVKAELENNRLTIMDSEIGYKAKETLSVDDKLRPALEKIYEDLDDNEDVQNFWSNMAV